MSNIQWTDVTLNCVTGCTKVSSGCRFCYSEKMTRRLQAMGSPKYGAGFGKVKTHPGELAKPLRWTKPRTIFWNSMGDTFHEDVPFGFIDHIFSVAALTQQHRHIILTKRAKRMAEYFAQHAADGPEMMDRGEANAEWLYGVMGPDKFGKAVDDVLAARFWAGLPNVVLMTSIEDQASADLRIPDLLRCPAAVHGVSAEPLLAEIDIEKWMFCRECGDYPGHWDWCGSAADSNTIRWVVSGAESGPGRRPCDTAWLKSLRDQCACGGVPYFCKQADIAGKLVKMPELDGRVWDQMPEVRRG